MDNQNMNINLGELLSSLSLALDIASNRIYQHSRRTAYVAYNIGKDMRISSNTLNNIYYGGFIHDIGMAGNLSGYSIFDIHNSDELKKEHCKLGLDIIRHLPLDSDIYNYVLYHHENWDGSGVFGVKGKDIPIGAQIIAIADYFDINYGSILASKEIDTDSIKKAFDRMKGKLFSSEVTESFLNVMDKDRFWLDLRFENLHQVLNTISPTESKLINISELKNIAEAFSILIDKKSRFTYEHSKGIAKIARSMALYFGYDDVDVDKIEIAAYLHDLGKLIVPNSILDKPGKLTEEEFQVIKCHSYYTKIILKQVRGLETIAEWAGNHHEKLEGSGYPEKIDYKDITVEDQIIAVSDIYQALTESRPYRKGLSKRDAMNILNSMGDKGFVSKHVIRALDEVV